MSDTEMTRVELPVNSFAKNASARYQAIVDAATKLNSTVTFDTFERNVLLLSLYKQELWEFCRLKFLYEYEKYANGTSFLEGINTIYAQIARGVYPQMCREYLESNCDIRIKEAPSRLKATQRVIMVDEYVMDFDASLFMAMWRDVLYHKVMENKDVYTAARAVSNDNDYRVGMLSRIEWLNSHYNAWKKEITYNPSNVPDYIAKEYEAYNRNFFIETDYINQNGYIDGDNIRVFGY